MPDHVALYHLGRRAHRGLVAEDAKIHRCESCGIWTLGEKYCDWCVEHTKGTA